MDGPDGGEEVLVGRLAQVPQPQHFQRGQSAQADHGWRGAFHDGQSATAQQGSAI